MYDQIWIKRQRGSAHCKTVYSQLSKYQAVREKLKQRVKHYSKMSHRCRNIGNKLWSQLQNFQCFADEEAFRQLKNSGLLKSIWITSTKVSSTTLRPMAVDPIALTWEWSIHSTTSPTKPKFVNVWWVMEEKYIINKSQKFSSPW